MLSSLPCYPAFWWSAAPTFSMFFCHSLSSCMHITVFQIQQTWIVTVSLLSDLWTCIQVFGNGVASKSDWFEPAQCKLLLFCAKTIVKESRKFELAHLKKKGKKHFGCLVQYSCNTFLCYWVCCRSWSTWKRMVHCHKGLQVDHFLLLCTIIYCVSEFIIYSHMTIFLPTLQ